jgi:two-component system sensor kinase
MPAAALVAGRYRTQRLLKAGHGVETWSGVDERTGDLVVLKTAELAGVPLAARLRFEHETRVLRSLQQEGVQLLLDSGVDDTTGFLVQQLVPGRTLEEVLASGPLLVPAATRIATDIATTLAVAHGQGVIHRDVKPANVIVTGGDGTPDAVDAGGGATLIDFGLARSSWLAEEIRDDLVGTARYLAPESAGLIDHPVDGRSDLYSLGVLLYECLAGAPPFDGATIGDLLRHHLSTPPPSLRSAHPNVPQVLDAIVQRLLRKDPAERYQSAEALAEDLEQLARALARGDRDPHLVIGRSDRRHSLTDPVFVGRVAELATLTALVDEAHGGNGGLVLLEGESGGGKSRLLDEVVTRARQSGLLVLRGQGVDRAARQPFQVLAGVADDLITTCAGQPEVAARLREQLSTTAESVALTLPSLAGLLGTEEGSLGPEEYGEQRSVDALRSLLDAVGDSAGPALIVLDDVQWADRLTYRLLDWWASDPGASGRLTVVAAFRGEEVPAGHPLRQISDARKLVLGPLSPHETRQLLESMAGPMPDPAILLVSQLAEGNPFLAAAVLRGLLECGALVGDPGGWRLDEKALGEVQTARRAAALLVQRLGWLSREAVELLSAGAVLGKQFDLERALDISGIDREAAPLALDEARHRRIVWVDERTGRCTFLHDKLREAVLDRMAAARRTEMHAAAADALAAASVDGVDDESTAFELAYHLPAAGRLADSLPHALAAARIARARHSLEVAANHYRLAADAAQAADCPVTLRAEIAEGWGDVLILQGAYPQAVECLQQARLWAERPDAAAALDGKLGEVAFKQGELKQAREYVEGALATLGRPVPRGLVLLLRLVVEAVVQALHTALPRVFIGRRPPDGAQREFLTIRLYSRLAYINWFQSGRLPCAWAHLREMNLAERYPPTQELGQAYSEHAPVTTMLPWYARGIRYAVKSLAVRRGLGDLWGEGQSLHFHGVVLYAATRYQDSITSCEQAIDLLDRTGDRWEGHTARWHVALAEYRLGNRQAALNQAKAIYQSAVAIRDHAAAGIALAIWAKATDGDVPADLLAAELARGTDDAHTTVELHVAEALRLRCAGDLFGAAEALADARRTISEAGLRQEYVAVVFPWEATLLREIAELTSGHRHRLRERRLRAAGRAAKRALRWSRAYRNNRPHALREAALVDSLRGRVRRARRRLERSIEAARLQGAGHEERLSTEALAQLSGEDAATGGGLAQGTALLQREGPDDSASTISLVDRFETLLRVGRSITAASGRHAVHAAIQDAAVQLLRGERCHLVDLRQTTDGTLKTRSGTPLDELSMTLIQRAVEVGEPVVATDAGESSSESLLLSGVRSVLAAPVYVDGRADYCFYLTHRQVGGLFGKDEIQLASFVSALAGAALEQLAGSESRFRSLAQNSSDVITLVTASGLVTYQSSSVERIFRLPPEQLAGRHIDSWIHPDDLAQFHAVVRDVVEGRAPDGTRVEVRVSHAGRSWRHTESAISNLLADPSVQAIVLNTRDISERRELEDELRRRAWHDPLTGLANRELFTERVREALAAGWPSGSRPAVLFLDVDDFKSVNDTRGHVGGDQLLETVAERLQVCVRPTDTVARFGGDEFAVLLVDASEEQARAVADRVLTAMAPPAALADGEALLRVSIGVALAGADDVEPEALLARADTAMYEAKLRGKNRWEMFRPAMTVRLQNRAALRTDLEWATARDELQLHFQPIVRLIDGLPLGVEALLRWNHPRRGLLHPGDFLQIAEDSGLVVGMGTWVVEHALQMLSRLPDPSALISVNVSARQLQEREFAEHLELALESYQADPRRVVIEITESTAISDVRTTVARLRALRNMGVRLALDDFGTGYSSLNYLRRFPVDYLKIDRSFVEGLLAAEDDAAIVRSVIGLASALGVSTVAEGVETERQRDALLELGCDFGQGLLWTMPAAADVTVDWLAAHPQLRLAGQRRPDEDRDPSVRGGTSEGAPS